MGTSSTLSLRRLVGASTINVVYLVIQTGLFLILTPATLRALGEDLFGLWMILMSVVAFAMMANFGSASTALRYSSKFSASLEQRDDFSAVVTFSYLFMLATALMAALILWLLRAWIAGSIEAEGIDVQAVTTAIGWLAIAIVPLFLSLVSRAILLGLVRNGLARGIFLAGDTLLWVGALLVGLRGGGIEHLGFLILAVNTLRFFTAHLVLWYVTRYMSPHFVWKHALVREMIGYSVFAWIASLGIFLFKNVDRLIIGVILGAASAGTYSIATSIAIRVDMLSNALAQVLTPYAGQKDRVRDRSHLVQVTRDSTVVNSAIMLVIVGIGVIWLDVLLRWWISPQFSEQNTTSFRIILFSYGLYCLYTPAAYILDGLGLMRIPAIIKVGSSLITLVVLWYATNSFGLLGASYANSFFVLLLLSNVYLLSHLFQKRAIVFKTLALDFALPIVGMILITWVSASFDLSLVFRSLLSIVVIAASSLYGLSGDRYQYLRKLNRSTI